MTAPRPSEWFTAEELAALALPVLPESARRVTAYARRQGWHDIAGAARPRAGRGGGTEFHRSILPMEAQRALVNAATPCNEDEGVRRVAAVTVVHRHWLEGSLTKTEAVHQAARYADVSVPTVWRWLSMIAGVPKDEYLAALTPAAPVASTPSDIVDARVETLPDDMTQLSDAQRATMTARLALLDALEGAPLPLVEMAEADEALHALALRASGHGKKQKLPSEPTLRRWRRFRREGGDIALAPVFKPRRAEPEWLAAFWRYYGIPSKPAIAWAHQQMIQEDPDGAYPPLRTVQRYVQNMGEIAKNRGRMSARAMRKFRPFRARSFHELEPLDVVSGDGHTLDAEVLHPVTGNAFRPEVGTIIDIATRRVVGWSVDLAENKMMVAAAMRRVCETGIPAIFYVDRGPGYKNQDLDDETTGMLARVGTSKELSLPRNAQAKGVIERLNATLWVAEAKAMPGFMGVDMDDDARQRVHKVSRDVIAGKSDRRQPLAEWPVFMEWAEDRVAAYNARPHSSLPKIVDPETGRKRHQSPDERWGEHVAAGWEPVTVGPDVLEDLWRPYSIRTVQRGLVKIGNGSYFARELDTADMHGQPVQVGQDIHDMEHVWIRTMDGQLICSAKRDANKSAYFQKSVVDAATEKRAHAQIKRIQRKEEELLANTRSGLAPLEIVPDAEPEVSPRVAERMARIAGEVKADPTVVQIPPDPEARLRLWRALQGRVDDGEVLGGVEERFHRNFPGTSDYRVALKMESFGQEKGPSKGAS